MSYPEGIPENPFTTTMVKIQYDCPEGCKCGNKVRMMKWCDADKNFDKNGGNHFCRDYMLKYKNPAKRPEVKEKMAQTNLERHGARNWMSIPENAKAASEALFGDEEKVKNLKEKKEKTNLERYGSKSPAGNKEVRAKMTQTNLDRYDFPHAMQNPEIQQKAKETNLERYNCESTFQYPEFREKAKKTMMANYGVEHYNQLPEMKDYLREMCRINFKEWWSDSLAQSERMSELINSGEWKSGYTNSKKGYCYPKNKCKRDKIFFRSSYEAIYCYYLENNPDVEWFSFEEFRIKYELDNKEKYYVPDFLIKWKNSDKLSIVETKAEFLQFDEKVIAKNFYTNLFSESNNMDFKMLINDDIKSLNISFEYLLEIGFAELYEPKEK